MMRRRAADTDPHGRASDHALRRPGRDRRSVVHRPAGEITAIIGPNGAGKTTVFNCITGFYKPTGAIGLATCRRVDALTQRHAQARCGKMFLLERMPGHRDRQQARVARTFQNIRLFPGMTVLENLLVAQHNTLMLASGFTMLGLFGLPRYRRGRARGDRPRARLAGAHRPFERADEPAGDLPYGAQRRLEIARAMCTRAAAALPRRAGGRPQPARDPPSSTSCCSSSATSTASSCC